MVESEHNHSLQECVMSDFVVAAIVALLFLATLVIVAGAVV